MAHVHPVHGRQHSRDISNQASLWQRFLFVAMTLAIAAFIFAFVISRMLFYEWPKKWLTVLVKGPEVRRALLRLSKQELVTHASFGNFRHQGDEHDPLFYPAFINIVGRDPQLGEWRYHWDSDSGVEEKGTVPEDVRALFAGRQAYAYAMLQPLLRTREYLPVPVYAVGECLFVNILPASPRM